MATRDNGRKEKLLHVKGIHPRNGQFVAGVVYDGDKVAGCAPILRKHGFWTMSLEEAIGYVKKMKWKYIVD